MLIDHLNRRRRERDAQALRRVRRIAETPCAPRQRFSGGDDGQARELLGFCSNDYLGLANHPVLVEAMAEGARRHGAGSGSSHLIGGHSRAHQALEDELAAWFVPYLPGAQALGFGTGYLANLALVGTLADADATVFGDKLNHASLVDGALLASAGARRGKAPVFRRFAHGRLDVLERELSACATPIRLIVTDAVFSMDGDLADLPALLALAERHDAWIVLDDAHGFGVLGDRGRGSLAHFGAARRPPGGSSDGERPSRQEAPSRHESPTPTESPSRHGSPTLTEPPRHNEAPLRSERLILMATLGKAAGVGGAFVAAHPVVIDALVQTARAYIYTTAAPPAIAHAALASLALVGGDEGDRRRAHLAALTGALRHGIGELIAARPGLGWRLAESATAIQPLLIGDNAAALALSAALEAQGLWVPAIRPPTVPAGSARLRITLSAAHTVDDVARLLAALQTAARDLP